MTEAAPFAARSLVLHEELHGRNSVALLPDIHSQIALARHRDDAESVEHLLIRGLMIIQSAKPVDERRMAEWRMALGLHYSRGGRPAEAEDFLRQGVLHALSGNELDDLSMVSAFALFEVLGNGDRLAEAERLAWQLLRATLSELGTPGPTAPALLQAYVASATESWMACRFRTGRPPDAIQAALAEVFQECSQLPLLAGIQEQLQNRAGS